jgi:hypothetical protein
MHYNANILLLALGPMSSTFCFKIYKWKRENKRNLFPLHTMKLHERVTVKHQALTSGLVGIEWLRLSRPLPSPAKIARRRLEEPQIQSGSCRAEQISRPYQEQSQSSSERMSSLQPSRDTNYVVLAPVYTWEKKLKLCNYILSVTLQRSTGEQNGIAGPLGLYGGDFVFEIRPESHWLDKRVACYSAVSSCECGNSKSINITSIFFIITTN